jgi:hypothetical protein
MCNNTTWGIGPLMNRWRWYTSSLPRSFWGWPDRAETCKRMPLLKIILPSIEAKVHYHVQNSQLLDHTLRHSLPLSHSLFPYRVVLIVSSHPTWSLPFRRYWNFICISLRSRAFNLFLHLILLDLVGLAKVHIIKILTSNFLLYLITLLP